MIHLDIQEYCHECPHFEPHKDPIFLFPADGPRIASDNRVYCYNKVRCDSIVRYLKEQMAKEKNKMIKVKTYAEFLDGREGNEENSREYIRYLRDIVHEINDRINRDNNLSMTHDELKAVETVSDYFEEMVKGF